MVSLPSTSSFGDAAPPSHPHTLGGGGQLTPGLAQGWTSDQVGAIKFSLPGIGTLSVFMAGRQLELSHPVTGNFLEWLLLSSLPGSEIQLILPESDLASLPVVSPSLQPSTPLAKQSQGGTSLHSWPSEWQCGDTEARKEDVTLPLPPFPFSVQPIRRTSLPPAFTFFDYFLFF